MSSFPYEWQTIRLTVQFTASLGFLFITGAVNGEDLWARRTFTRPIHQPHCSASQREQVGKLAAKLIEALDFDSLKQSFVGMWTQLQVRMGGDQQRTSQHSCGLGLQTRYSRVRIFLGLRNKFTRPGGRSFFPCAHVNSIMSSN